ncbi:hypothetical protein B0H19DRAFT_1116303 [Mycena capillaripes]|nr:hypothetical protein B0H19DRAFT_1116303 [Mycena capillaripes]
MSGVSEASLSLLQSVVPTNNANKIMAGVIILGLTACIIYYTSPMRLTAALVAALHEAEEVHFCAIEAGILSGSDTHTKMLSKCDIFQSWNIIIDPPAQSPDEGVDHPRSQPPQFAFEQSGIPGGVKRTFLYLASMHLGSSRAQDSHRDTKGKAVETARYFSRTTYPLARFQVL